MKAKATVTTTEPPEKAWLHWREIDNHVLFEVFGQEGDVYIRHNQTLIRIFNPRSPSVCFVPCGRAGLDKCRPLPANVVVSLRNEG